MTAIVGRRDDTRVPGDPPYERGLTHLPALDGLRGIAVLAVLAFHLQWGWADAGFLGVSVFFTLSGFLITSLVLHEHSSYGRIDLRAFWRRRWRRLMPAAFVTLGGVALIGVLAATQTASGLVNGWKSPGLGGDLFSSLTYVANWHFVFTETSYADLFTSPSPLQHFWSLAIEEQYYLLFPIAAWAVTRRTRKPRRALGLLAGGIAAASTVAMVLTYRSGNTDLAYLGTHTRAAELAIGTLVAVLVAPGRRRVVTADAQTASSYRPGRLDALAAAAVSRRGQIALVVLAVLSVGLLATLWTTVDQSSSRLYEGGFALHAIATAGLIVAATTPGPVARALSVRPLRAVGLVSYGLYLYHWPVFLWVDANLDASSAARTATKLTVTAALATASYALVERPVRFSLRAQRTFGRLAPVGAAVVLVVALSLPAGSSPRPAQALVDGEVDVAATLETIGSLDVSIETAAAASDSPETVERVVLLGDSLMGWGYEWFEARLAEHGVTSVYAGGPGTGPLSPQGGWASQLELLVESFDPQVIVIEACCSYARTPDPSTFEHAPEPYTDADGNVVEAGDERLYDLWGREVRNILDVATSGGAKVLMVKHPPMATNGFYGPIEEHAARLNEQQLAIADELGIGVIDWFAVLAPSGEFAWELPDDSGTLRPVRWHDGVHLESWGNELLARSLIDVVAS